MLFNSFTFLAFFPIVVALYWVLPHKFRNPMLLLASYYFYMNWQPVYALLILLSSVTTWACGLLIGRYVSHKRLWLTACLLLNFGILFLYKYAGFVSRTVHDALQALGIAIEIPEFTLLLPVGISFYTFQAVGYTIDVYRGTLKPERSLSDKLTSWRHCVCPTTHSPTMPELMWVATSLYCRSTPVRNHCRLTKR